MLLGLAVTGLAIGVLGAVGWVVPSRRRGPTLDTLKPIGPGRHLGRLRRRRRRAWASSRRDILRTPVTDGDIPQTMKRGDGRDRGPPLLQAQGRRLRGHPPRRGQERASGDDIQGGSTLTMQLIRNLYTGERARTGVEGYKRKIREAKLAEDLENRHPGRAGKNWILDKYLNSVPYGTVGGQTAVGVQAAARMFFDKPAEQADPAPGGAAGGPPAGAVGTTTRSWTPSARSSAATRSCDEDGRPGLHQPGEARRRRCAAALGVRRNRLLHRAPRGLLLRLRQVRAHRALRRSTRSARAACASTRRSTCTSSAWRARHGGPARPARTAPRRIVTIDPRTG